MKVELTLACGKYDRTEAIRDGSIQVDGAEINYLVLPPPEIFWRMLKFQEFEVSEMSLSSYLISREKGYPDLMAIPVFPSRTFRHGSVFVREGSGLTRPEDLRGKKIGVPEYQLTAALFARGFLQHEYGVEPKEVSWWVEREEKCELHLPLQLSVIPEGKSLEGMLLAGQLDALILPNTPRALGRGINRLFPNRREVESDYYRRTGIFPIMHTLVIRGDIYNRHPWLARSLYKAFESAKNQCLRDLYTAPTRKSSLVWLAEEVEQERAILGEDIWPYGLEANSRTLEAAAGFAYEQGLLSKKPVLEDLFASGLWTNER